ncbi:MAG: tRNA pseudouridine(55) synthase TruB [Chlamydiia bacterium]|nr:tRNA pseudouridine(55) synthase TruB [Chlamydiia bacterium]
MNQHEGILLVDKPKGVTSFSLIRQLRRLLNVKKIGHAGTLDPLATGVMIYLIGSKYTKQSDKFLATEKEYRATLTLGSETDSYDSDGVVIATNPTIPTSEEIHTALNDFQGTLWQTPPMHSAKKVNGQKLYNLARQGKEIERKPSQVTLSTDFISYTYPTLTLHVTCSKGTYIRSIAHDLGKKLGCLAHLSGLIRTRSGSFSLADCLSGDSLTLDAIRSSLRHKES